MYLLNIYICNSFLLWRKVWLNLTGDIKKISVMQNPIMIVSAPWEIVIPFLRSYPELPIDNFVIYSTLNFLMKWSSI